MDGTHPYCISWTFSRYCILDSLFFHGFSFAYPTFGFPLFLYHYISLRFFFFASHSKPAQTALHNNKKCNILFLL